MKMRYFWLSLLVFSPAFLISGIVQAQCSGFDNYGSVNLKLPVLTKRGAYNIWSRVQSPSSTARYALEINAQSCYEINSQNISPNQWQWLSKLGQDNKLTHRFDQTVDNTVKIIGLTNGLKFDRLILIQDDCVPLDKGENCQSGGSVEVLSPTDQVPSTVYGPVSGLLYVSNTLISRAKDISKVEYYDGTQKIQSINKSGQLDTTLLPNGKRMVTARITLKDGSKISELAELDVQNEVTTLSPLWRWLRINQSGLKLLSVIFSGLAALILTVYIIRKTKIRRRMLNFHGF